MSLKPRSKFLDIRAIEEEYFNRKHSNLDSHLFLNKIYHLKRKYIMAHNEAAIKELNNFQDYVKHDINRIMYINSGLLSLISTIFLPLTFFVSFFGMNFKSMGMEGIKKNHILSIKHGEKFVFGISMIAIVVVLFLYYYLDFRKISIL